MTSLAFILGVLPCRSFLAGGRGAEMRRTLGMTVFSGMLGVTAFGIFLTPVFFYVVDYVGSAPIFSSKIARTISQIALNIVCLGIPSNT